MALHINRSTNRSTFVKVRTDCDGCGFTYNLYTEDADGILIGDECPKCGYYTTRYMPGMNPME